MPRIARPLYRRHAEYVAVKPIRTHTNSVIKPGEDVKLRPHQMRSLYQRRRIGPKGHAWTEQALKQKGFPLPFVSDNPRASELAPPAAPAIEPHKDQRPWAILDTDQRFKTKAEALAWIEAATDLPEGTEPVNDGLIWAIEGNAERFTKKADAAEWIAAQPAQTSKEGDE